MTGRFVALACAISVCTSIFTARVSADGGRSRVTVVRSSSDDRLLRDANTRLRAELSSAGFEVVEVDSAPGDPRAEVERAANAGDSFATVSVDRAGQGAFADVWISDHVTGKTVVRRLEVGAEANAAAVLAIRALELLRASLLEIAAPPRASEPVLAPARDVTQFIEPVLPRATQPPEPGDLLPGTTLGISALGLHGLRGVGPALGPSLRVSQGITRHWFARVSVAASLANPEITHALGNVSVRQMLAGVDLGFATTPRPVAAIAWLGAGVFDLHGSGSAVAPYHSRDDDLVSFMVDAGVGALWQIGPRLGLCAELGALLLLPRPVVVIVDEPVGRAGWPSLSLALGIVLGL